MKKDFLKEGVVFWLPVIVWAGFIFYLSSIPNLKAVANPRWDELIRSLLHSFFYLVFCLLWWRAFHFLDRGKKLFFSVLAVFLYSLSDELHQSFVPTRTFQIQDLLVDNLGSLIGGIGLWKFSPNAPGILKSWVKKLALD